MNIPFLIASFSVMLISVGGAFFVAGMAYAQHELKQATGPVLMLLYFAAINGSMFFGNLPTP